MCRTYVSPRRRRTSTPFHSMASFIHSFIHSFIPPRGVTPLRITSHRIARTVRSLSHARRRAPSRLGGFPQRGHHAFENVDARRRRTIDPSIDRCARATRPLIYTHNFTHHTPPRPVQTLRVPLPWFTTRQPGSRVAPPRSRRLDRRHIGCARERRVCSSIGRARALQRRRMRCV